MVYDFRCEGARLTLSVTPREAVTDGGEWHIAASQTTSPDLVVGEWAPTRKEALAAVGRAWSHQHLPFFDWSAIEAAMLSVRAI